VTIPTRIKDMPDRERPRERLAAAGSNALTDAELIAILLRTGMKGQSAIEIGRERVQYFGSLRRLARASLEELQVINGIGRDKAKAPSPSRGAWLRKFKKPRH
jgi:DNA repair protein RadC